MFKDLKGEANMSPTVGILYSAVKENYNRLKCITEGMTQEEIDYQGPNDNLNSTAQLMRHIMYVDLNWTYRMEGYTMPYSIKMQYGPMIDVNNRLPMVKGKSLNTYLSEYDNVFDKFKNICTELTDADLEKVVTFGHNNEKRATIHMADHNRYHQAHINQLRKWYAMK
ncbi:YkkA [Gracilibacillus halophilus YIM-C55.5]|uniref:YkkA n=1 Tax=Gracilibacillus halophilus YIM-C55.5 TaxID=1308866 RepID=N4WLG3_9BACI|nr:DinB family protein [Gracilibacillus halophilus]ENH97002.1 YkkA [Gracilibacillus halophilus YIM-C55.5]